MPVDKCCPTSPDTVVERIAFKPPPKGSTYTVHLRTETTTVINGAEEINNRPFFIFSQLLRQEQINQYYEMIEHSTFHTVQTSTGNTLMVVKTKPSLSEFSQGNYVFLFAQPNHTDIGIYLQPDRFNLSYLANTLRNTVYAFDYSGYGYSSGSSSEIQLYNDIRSVYEMIRRETRKKIILIGYSLGTAPVIDISHNQPEYLAAVILIAPFTSALSRAFSCPAHQSYGNIDRFRNIDKVPNIIVPTLVIHGSKDTTIGIEHGKKTHSLLPLSPPIYIVDGADHDAVFNGTRVEVINRIIRFVDTEIEELLRKK